MTISDPMTKLRAATAQAASAVADMAQAVEDGEIRSIGNVGAGETTPALADALRLLIEVEGACSDDPDTFNADEASTQLYGALTRFLEDRT
jgi:hypothetical protein